MRNHLSEMLRANDRVSVTFRKKDGTERVMLCTLKEGIVIPHEKTTDRVKEPRPDMLSVWDVEAAGWRTITIPNILGVVVGPE